MINPIEQSVSLDEYIETSIEPQCAKIKVNSLCLANNVKVTEKSLLEFLKKNGIVYGVKTDVIKEIVQKMLFDTEVVIAEGKEPTTGLDGKITFEIDVSKNLRPALRKDGTVDFRDIQSINLVTAGQKIARRTPPTLGAVGKTVTGKDIEALPGNDIKLPAGRNTTISEDGIFLVSSKSGSVFHDGVLVHVTDILEIPTDINFSVGNIKYSGDVIINGNVLPGFSVEAEGSIIIKGEVESAQIISRNGTVSIEKGLIGKGDAAVYGKRGVHVSFAQDTTITTEGTVTIDKYCMNCDITCETISEGLPHAAILGGEAKVFSSVDVGIIGNDKGIKTKISIIDKEEDAKKKKIIDLKKLEKELAKQLEPVRLQLSTKASIFKSAKEHATDRHKAELKKWLDAFNEMSTKLKYVQTSISDLTQSFTVLKSHDGFIKGQDTIFPGTEISYFGISLVVKIQLQGKWLVLKNGQIVEG